MLFLKIKCINEANEINYWLYTCYTLYIINFRNVRMNACMQLGIHYVAYSHVAAAVAAMSQ